MKSGSAPRTVPFGRFPAAHSIWHERRVDRFARFFRAREAEPSGAANPARAVGLAAGDFFFTDWLAAAVAAASEVGASLRR